MNPRLWLYPVLHFSRLFGVFFAYLMHFSDTCPNSWPTCTFPVRKHSASLDAGTLFCGVRVPHCNHSKSCYHFAPVFCTIMDPCDPLVCHFAHFASRTATIRSPVINSGCSDFAHIHSFPKPQSFSMSPISGCQLDYRRFSALCRTRIPQIHRSRNDLAPASI